MITENKFILTEQEISEDAEYAANKYVFIELHEIEIFLDTLNK